MGTARANARAASSLDTPRGWGQDLALVSGLQILCQALVLILGLAAPAGAAGSGPDAATVMRSAAVSGLPGPEASESTPEREVATSVLVPGAFEGAAEVEDDERHFALPAPAAATVRAIRPAHRSGVPSPAPVRPPPTVTDGLSRGPPALG